MKRILLLGLALMLALAPGAYAQVMQGIYGTVADESGAVLPGATVALTGDLGTRSTTSGPNGEFRFLNLDRGRYKVTVTLAGFTTVTREVIVTTGENVTLDFGLKVAQVAESVTVTAETPLVDPKKRGTATTMTTEELLNVPNARDPWGVLKNVPGVLLDRVNIAGNENGQQASVAGKGSTSGDKMWTLDGVNVTDMSATGASPTYFDFEAFQEINVSTGGNELQVQSGGIGINLVTKRGTNAFHGSARYLLADGDWSPGNVPDELVGDARLQGEDKADRVNEIKDWGFDLGGPIVKDRLWFYGTFGRQDIKAWRLTQTPDDTVLDSFNTKINWQATNQTMVSAYWFNGKKQKFGRSPGYVGETDDFLWNQDNAYVDGGLPGGLWKLQADHTFSPNFFVSAKAAYYDTGFGLFPRGGGDESFTVDYVRGDAIGSYYTYRAVRPQKIANLDGSYFFGGLGGNNELKFGFGYRDLKTFSDTIMSGDKLAGWIEADDIFAWVVRDGLTEYVGNYVTAYVGDVFTKDRLTVNVGARWDLQTAKNLPSESIANPAFPNLLPALQFPGNDDNVIEWNDISPRVGLSYALDDARKTVVRASFARYASQLSFGNVAGSTGENPVGRSILAYGWTDANGDRMVQPGEVNLDDFRFSVNVDRSNPAAVGITANKVDRDLRSKKDGEYIVGLDRELVANLAVGAAFTYRRATDWEYRPRLAGACADPQKPTADTCPIIQPGDYIPNNPTIEEGLTGTSYSPPSALVTAGRGGRIRTNRPGYYTNFKGLELTATKRLANRWMARAAFSFNDWTEHWEDGVTPVSFGGNPTPIETDPLVQGGQVALLSGGSGKASFYSSVKWQLYTNALVQLPWDLEIAGALFGRQGGPFPVSVRARSGSDGTLSVLSDRSPEVDTERYPNVWNLDLRLAKNFKIGRTGLTVSGEAFNALNNNVVLSRFRWASPELDRIEEILAPRTFRIGARFSF